MAGPEADFSPNLPKKEVRKTTAQGQAQGGTNDECSPPALVTDQPSFSGPVCATEQFPL